LKLFEDDAGFTLTTVTGKNYYSKRVVVTAGTFLDGKLHFGPRKEVGGRGFSPKGNSLGEIFSKASLKTFRFKTGTPARLVSSSVDTSLMEEQPSDSLTRNFSSSSHPFTRQLPQVSCYMTWTNSETMRIIRENKGRSPIFNGDIVAIGPRYCPSIEDKGNRYPDRDNHHVFVEPEGLSLETFYPNGLSTSLPVEVQEQFLRTIKGFERAEIAITGYAVEYDVFDATRLRQTLESKDIPGLYFAGQINGTSGYEEAAGQGVVAGANAALAVFERAPLLLSRFDSYIAVMIDDIISNHRDEPYRLFTARSENRLYLREDNVVLRMYPYRKQLGINSFIDEYSKRFVSECELLAQLCDRQVYSAKYANERFLSAGYGAIPGESMRLADLLRQ
ncbi:MAG: tRNA uridine-5-carboxymethylaminomethyl(34) synthesis enzyme MnmG, partial [Oligoflexia bacterium]|nr:tRNA uridine-5-carboxymethylaminomethyl(34) synthesis enzyme MnmG [Oligoflexia bacterium]